MLGQAAVTVMAALCALGLAVRRAAALGAARWRNRHRGESRDGGAGLRRRCADRSARLSAFYLGEAVKLLLVIVLFVVVLKVVKVAPLAMFAAFAATFLVYWIALLSALPALSGARRQRLGDGVDW